MGSSRVDDVVRVPARSAGLASSHAEIGKEARAPRAPRHCAPPRSGSGAEKDGNQQHRLRQPPGNPRDQNTDLE